MKLNLSKPDEANKAVVRFAKLLKDGSKIELREIKPPRTIKQNNYIHCLFTLWGVEYGYTLDEAKWVVKIELGYTYIKNGITFMERTSEMNTDEIRTFIDKFRNWSSANGCYLPTSKEYKLRNFDYSQEIERAEQMQKRYGY